LVIKEVTATIEATHLEGKVFMQADFPKGQDAGSSAMSQWKHNQSSWSASKQKLCEPFPGMEAAVIEPAKFK